MNVDQRMLLALMLAVLVAFALSVAGVFVFVVRPWLRAFLHGTPVSMLQIVAMRLRGNPVGLVIDAYIALRRAGVDVHCGDVENAFVNGRNGILSADDLVRLVKKTARPL